MTITKHYIAHPFLSHSIFPDKDIVNEKEFDGNYAEDDIESDEKKEPYYDYENDSMESLDHQRRCGFHAKY